MSLLLSGAKTVTIAGSEMQCVEIYTGESYTLPFQFKYANGVAIDCTGWSVNVAAKWYTANITYPSPGLTALNQDEIIITDLTLDNPQPSAGASANLTATFTTTSTGIGYIYVPIEITGGYGSPNPSPTPTVNDTDSILVILTMGVSRTDQQSGLTDFNREPLGVIVRYQ